MLAIYQFVSSFAEIVAGLLTGLFCVWYLVALYIYLPYIVCRAIYKHLFAR